MSVTRIERLLRCSAESQIQRRPRSNASSLKILRKTQIKRGQTRIERLLAQQLVKTPPLTSISTGLGEESGWDKNRGGG